MYDELNESGLKKPTCFSDYQWQVYRQELKSRNGQKLLDLCFDCTVEYQSEMKRAGRCDFPNKKLGKIVEYRLYT